MDDASPIEYTKRKYAEVVKSTGISELEGTIAAQGVKLISELFHLDGLYGKSGAKAGKTIVSGNSPRKLTLISRG